MFDLIANKFGKTCDVSVSRNLFQPVKILLKYVILVNWFQLFKKNAGSYDGSAEILLNFFDIS